MLLHVHVVLPCPNAELPVPVANPPKDPSVGVGCCFTPKLPNPPNPRRQTYQSNPHVTTLAHIRPYKHNILLIF
jgi:hypothetical protein